MMSDFAYRLWPAALACGSVYLAHRFASGLDYVPSIPRTKRRAEDDLESDIAVNRLKRPKLDLNFVNEPITHVITQEDHGRVIPDDGQVLLKAPVATMADLPVELHLSIMECLPEEALLVLTSVSSTLRQLSSSVYFQRRELVKSYEGYTGPHHSIRLHGIIPPVAVLTLLSTVFATPIVFSFDLFYLIQYEAELVHFCSKANVLRAAVTLPIVELDMLQLPGCPEAIRSFLASLSHSPRCTVLRFESENFPWLEPRVVNQAKRSRTSYCSDMEILSLMKTVHRLSIHTSLLETKALWKSCRLLLAGPSVGHLHLRFHSIERSGEILSKVHFPALKTLNLSSPCEITPSLSFLRRHPLLSHIAFVDIGPPLSLSPSSLLAKRLTLKARKPIKFLGFDTLQISDKFQTWLPAFDPNTPPEVINVIPAQWCPDIENDESCKSLQGLSRCLNALAHQKLLARQLEISFPYDIFNHIAAFHQEPKSLCAVPQIAVRGFEDVKFKFYFTRHDKGLAGLLQDYTIKWMSYFPNLRSLTISNSFPEDTNFDLTPFLSTIRMGSHNFERFSWEGGHTWLYEENGWKTSS